MTCVFYISYFEHQNIVHVHMVILYDGPFLQLFTKRQNFRLVQIKRICSRQNKCERKIEIWFGKGRKHCGKRRKCWLPAFSPFPSMFSKGLSVRVIKSRTCVVKG